MQNHYLRMLILCVTLYSFQTTSAQYCTPVPATTGVWILEVGFNTLPGGVLHNSGAPFKSEGYTNLSASSSGNISANCPATFNVNLQSCGNRGAITYNLRIFADWNQDNDFDDAGEIISDLDGTMVSGDCAFSISAPAFTPPAGATPGNIRIRCAVREGGTKASACGNYVGEVEDYTLVLAGNHAPVLDNSGTPFINPLAEAQTNSTGFLVNKIVTTKISDADVCSPQKGIAIINATASNGTWQYKIGAGSWTSIAAASLSNALLLPDTCRMRFVPTSPGIAQFVFKAWDKSSGTMNSYYNITAIGGVSAFSNNNDTAAITVYSNAETAPDSKVYMPTAYSPAGGNNLYTSSLSRGSGVLKEAQNISSDDVAGYGYDIAMDLVNNKLVWCGGEGGNKVLRSNYDGTGVEVLMSGLTYPTGIATGGNKIFVIDYGVGIYSMNLDGSGITPLFGGEIQTGSIYNSSDIEFYNNKLYYANQNEGAEFKIVQSNTDGTGYVDLVSTPNTIYGMDVVNETIYWIEFDGTNVMMKSIAITGGEITTIAAANDGQQWFDLFVDISGAKIYFLEPEQSGNPPTLQSVPITGGEITKRLLFENTFYSLVFDRPLVTLPLRFIEVKAQSKKGGIQVNWSVASEEANCNYTIERSLNGINYSEAGKVQGQQKSNYSWMDGYVLSGSVYYRIKATNADGKLLYSAIVKLSASSNPGIAVFPTHVSNKNLYLKLNDKPGGLYLVSVYNANGQVVFKKQVQHTGGSSVNSIALPGTVRAGFYSVIVSSGAGVFSQRVIVE